jgi:pyruvate/2-oxoglutarate dehydrogenase complex dihydrolipoamide dehydrogenase (E3) component
MTMTSALSAGLGRFDGGVGRSAVGRKNPSHRKGKELGGDCLHFGCVPSKTLIRTARAYHTMKNSQAFGLPAVEVPPVDFQKVRERIRSVIAAIQEHDSEERFCRLGAKWNSGNLCFGRAWHPAERKSVSAKNWVIATGSSPDSPPIEGLDKTPYLTNKEIFSLDRLPIHDHSGRRPDCNRNGPGLLPVWGQRFP